MIFPSGHAGLTSLSTLGDATLRDVQTDGSNFERGQFAALVMVRSTRAQRLAFIAAQQFAWPRESMSFLGRWLSPHPWLFLTHPDRYATRPPLLCLFLPLVERIVLCPPQKTLSPCSRSQLSGQT